jgi:hypothetical protein
VEVGIWNDTVTPLHEPLPTEELTTKKAVNRGENFVKFTLMLLAALASTLVAPACAQSPPGYYDARVADPDTQVLAFLRIPFGEQKRTAKPRIGFGVFADCDRISSRNYTAHASACESQTIRSLEMSRDFHGRDWLISFSGDRRWVGFARWIPGLGLVRDTVAGPVFSDPSLPGPGN